MAGRKSSGSLLPWLGIAAVIVVLDQLTKALIVARFALGDSVTVTSFFNVVRAHNSGAAFSFLAGASGWQRWFFIGLAVAVSVALVTWIWRAPRGDKLLPFALSLILGGAVGNLIDRVVHGYVVDFIHAHWGAAYFPAFNVADSAITIGAVLLLLDAFREHRA